MDLKSILPKKEPDSPKENMWSVVLEPGWVQAGIWQIVDDKAHIVAVSAPFAWKEDIELIKATDAALSSAVQHLQEDAMEPLQAVFAVMSSWVEDDEIKKEYLAKIQQMCKELSIKPVGFVVLPEAIVNYTKSREGSPVSSVIIGVTDESLEVCVYKLGNLVGSTQVARSLSITDDLAEGITRLVSTDPLPSRIILYDGKEGELDEEKQALMNAHWDEHKEIEFLHTPKIEVLDTKDKVYAVSLAGAADIANVTSLSVDNYSLREDPVDEDHANVVAPDIAALGFAVGKDVSQDVSTVDKDLPLPHQDIPVDVGQDISTDLHQDAPRDLPSLEGIPAPSKDGDLKSGKKKLSVSKLTSKLPKLRMPSLPKRKAKISSEGGLGKKALVAGAVFFVILMVAGTVSWWFLPKAEVTIYLSTSLLEEKIEITVDSNAPSPDIDQAILPGTLVVITIGGEKTKSTTGSNTVGDKATGEITIYRVGSKTTVSSGETVSGSTSLKFTLDTDVAIASGSASSPGTTNVSVTASEIGSKYNLAANSAFTISNFSASDMEGINDSDFSGGTSREIQAVSEEDQEDLEEALMDQLQAEALESLRQELSSSCPDCVLIEESYTANIIKKTFSNEVGGEADEVTLTIDLDATALAVGRDDLNSLAQEVLKDRIPDGFVLRDEQIDASFSFDGENEDGVYTLTASIQANLFPEIDTDEIAIEIKGKYPQIAKDFLVSEVPGFVEVNVVLIPRLPPRLNRLPNNPKNIDVVISAPR